MVKAEKASDILTLITGTLKRWEDGDVTSRDTANYLRNAVHRLNRACWCADPSDRSCCMIHNKHVEPHANCILG